MKKRKQYKTPKFELTSEEKAMEREAGWKALEPSSEIYKNISNQVARHSAEQKEARITTRLNVHDLELLKKMASEQGLPYQTLLGSLIHKYVSGRLVDLEDAKLALETLLKNKGA